MKIKAGVIDRETHIQYYGLQINKDKLLNAEEKRILAILSPDK